MEEKKVPKLKKLGITLRENFQTLSFHENALYIAVILFVIYLLVSKTCFDIKVEDPSTPFFPFWWMILVRPF